MSESVIFICPWRILCTNFKSRSCLTRLRLGTTRKHSFSLFDGLWRPRMNCAWSRCTLSNCAQGPISRGCQTCEAYSRRCLTNTVQSFIKESLALCKKNARRIIAANLDSFKQMVIYYCFNHNKSMLIYRDPRAYRLPLTKFLYCPNLFEYDDIQMFSPLLLNHQRIAWCRQFLRSQANHWWRPRK